MPHEWDAEPRRKHRNCDKSLLQPQSSVQSSSARAHRRADFSFVEVREYKRILGAHPSCFQGISLGIDWEYRPSKFYLVDEWETMRSISKSGYMILDRETRELILSELGYDQHDFARAIRETNRIKSQRR